MSKPHPSPFKSTAMLAAIGLVALVMVVFVSPLLAAESMGLDPTGELATGRSGPSKELLLTLAYGFVWLGFGGYALWIHRKLSSVQKEVTWLAENLTRDDPED